MKSFKGSDGKYHFVYRTHNLVNGKEYTGKHSTYNLDDGYYGSGKLIKHAVKKYGIENFAVEILSFHKNEVEALKEERKIINEEYIYDDNTYNLMLGGMCNFTGRVTVKDKEGNTFSVHTTDPRYLSGDLVHVSTGLIVAKDKDGNTYIIHDDDSRYLSRELVGIAKGNINPGLHKGEVSVHDKDGNRFMTSVDDPRFISGELIALSKGRITVKDKKGNTMAVSIDDPRYLSGELVHHTTGMIAVKDKEGNTFSVPKNDPRYLSGELVGHSKGHRYKISKPFEQVKCPHCKKVGRKSSMIRWHFDNCKFMP